MKTRYLFAISAAILLNACSTQQAYYGTQEAQKNQCERLLPDSREYDRCMEKANMDYKEYQQRREELN